MTSHLRGNVVGYLAIFCFVIGGTAQAVDGPLPGQNTVGSEDIIGNEVLSDDIGNGRIFNVDIADNIILSGKMRNSSLIGADVSNAGAGSLTGVNVADSTLFNDNSMTGADADETTLFNNNSLAAADLAATSVGSSELADDSIASDEVIDGSLTTSDVADGTIGVSEILLDSVRASDLASLQIVSDNEDVAEGEEEVITVTCPAGTVAIGGSAFTPSSPTEQPRFYGSFPLDADTTFPSAGEAFTKWRGVFRNDDNAGAMSATTQVICLGAGT